MVNYKIKPDMVMETLEDQVTAIEALRVVLTGIRREKFENKVESKELFDTLLSKRTQCMIGNNMIIFEYQNVTKEQFAMLCDYFQTELIFNGWKMESLYIEDANRKNEKYWFDIGVEKDDISMAASYRNDKLVIVKMKQQ